DAGVRPVTERFDRGAAAAAQRHLRANLVLFSQPVDHLTGIGHQIGGEPLEGPDRTGAPAPAPDGLDEQVWELALAATTLRVELADEPALLEATAALQDLAIDLVDASTAASRLAELQHLQADLMPEIKVSHNGPYLVTNAREMVNWLGEKHEIRPQMALCRCGGSAIKPFCDGTHARIGFRDAKDPKRVADRRDRYQGVRVTILDNRGLCAHSGFCTDRLASAFHLGEEPFVTPSGARMDDLVRAVRNCPSGALSFAVGDHEQRREVDQNRPQTIEVSKDGPYRITGGLPLVAHDGADVARNDGASREHYSLCRCGHSQNKPFCSGMHFYVNFVDPQPDPEHEPTLFEWAGGFPALLRMTQLFYEKYVPEDPLLSPLFADMSPDHPQRVAAWLGEVFGGPKAYSNGYGGYERMLSQHIGKAITEDKRARWVQLLCRSADEAGLPADAEFRAAFTAYLEWGSRLAVENSTPGAKPPPHMPVPRWWWVCDATPGARVSALAPPSEEDEPAALPGPDEAVSFDRHIKPLFRSTDRRSMQFAFDLWSYDDVSTHAAAILDRLRAGTMPCDGAWPAPSIDAFQRWVDGGKPH
ncbi:MAG TPA: CDGSH iron-sulfur domain-containing protein, partial [Gemmatimonadales bacterium]|nr:CDGSH iron-sulfur domain-containing protein [Gemmatimonadales bacterium]